MIIKRKPSCIVLARPLVYSNPCSADGPRSVPLSFLCADDSFCLCFLIFLLCYMSESHPCYPARPLAPLWRKPVGVSAVDSWVSFTQLLPHPFTSNKHTEDVGQQTERMKSCK
ncbi:hypothetical protein ATANTOWER_019559 [Ataeniobius toweri]|uniref:Uncharacterized protein n=1 Tax=Ataeniobius toweri TaxID=208326 RepID=A0ABU7A1V3_9TELE|nr:hypothetical protein [Ataeniobius toweri]